MYAVIEAGGKQYIVRPNDTIEIEKVDKKREDKLKIDNVLLISDKEIKIGEPYLKSCSVNCTILEHFKQDKKITFKYRRRKNSKTKQGHRQEMTRLRIDSIKIEGKEINDKSQMTNTK